MKLLCLNDIITDNLAIQIDISKLDSWNLNSEFSVISLNKWKNAISDNINLIDFGLTEFDNGRTNKMYDGITLSPNDLYLKLNRIGYNVVDNPTTGETSGSTITTKFDIYPMSGLTSSAGNYFELNGGYLQGFFKLNGYNYELLPSRYNNGITFETILNIHLNSKGIFLMLGTRSEDKYNEYFSGEMGSGITKTGLFYFSGVTTSDDNYLQSKKTTQVNKTAFGSFEDRKETIYTNQTQLSNLSSNVIAFEITEDRRIGYKYINENGNLIVNSSPKIINNTDWTLISIVFTPDNIINDISTFYCAPKRVGKLIFYVNGRPHWIINDFPEFYFHELNTNKNLQIGVPYSISWGGGSFGLRHSWHYDYQTYILFNNQNISYVKNNFVVESNPFPAECDPYESGILLKGISLSADTTSFFINKKCKPNINEPISVIRIEYTGNTKTTGDTYYIKYKQPIKVLSNRDYDIELDLFNGGFFNTFNPNNDTVINKVSIVLYGSVDINVISDIEYQIPIITTDLIDSSSNLLPFPDKQQFEYLSDGILYYGETGVPIVNELSFMYGYKLDNNIEDIENVLNTGSLGWKTLRSKFKISDNTGLQTIFIGLLIETNYGFNVKKPLYIKNITYTGADILVNDDEKDNLFIEENFSNSFIGGIQKLRIYNNALTSPEILHNSLIESKINPNLNLVIANGGRIITKQAPYTHGQQTAGSDIRKSIKYRNVNGSYRNLSTMIDIWVVIKSRTNPNIELVKFKKVAGSGWLALIPVDMYTYDFIVPNTITDLHANEILFAEIKFQWADPNDIDNTFEKIVIVNISSKLLDNTIKNY